LNRIDTYFFREDRRVIMHIRTSDQERLELGFGGISCNWGVHIAGLYETEKERDEIIIGYLHEGAEKRDLQLYCPTERTREDFEHEFTEKCSCCSALVKDAEIFQFFSTKELYYPTGVFSPWDMDDGLNAFYENSQRSGKRNIRATAEMCWALEAKTIPGVEHLMAYESRLNYFIPGKPWISICMYNIRKFSGDMIMGVLKTHPYTISGKVITENPYYVDPGSYLEKNAPEFLVREKD